MAINVGDLVATARVDIGEYVAAFAEMKRIRDQFMAETSQRSTNVAPPDIAPIQAETTVRQAGTAAIREQTAARNAETSTISAASGPLSAYTALLKQAGLTEDEVISRLKTEGLLTKDLTGVRSQLNATTQAEVSQNNALRTSSAQRIADIERETAARRLLQEQMNEQMAAGAAGGIAPTATPGRAASSEDLAAGASGSILGSEQARSYTQQSAAAKDLAADIQQLNHMQEGMNVAKAAGLSQQTQVLAGYIAETGSVKEGIAAFQKLAVTKSEVTRATQELAAAGLINRNEVVKAGEAASKTTNDYFRLTGSGNEAASMHLRLSGSIGLVVVALGIVSVAALKEAADFQTSQVRIQAATGLTAQGISNLNSSFNLGLNSTTQFAQALAPVAGILATVAQGSDINAAKNVVMASSQDLAAASGASLNESTRAVLETLRNYGLGADQAKNVADTLYTSNLRTGQSVTSLAQTYGTLREQLGSLNPTIEDAQSILEDAATHGSDSTRIINGLGSGFRAMLEPTKEIYKALVDYDIKTVDATGHALAMHTMIDQLRGKFGDLGNQQEIAALKELGFGTNAEAVNQFLADQNKKAADTTGSMNTLADAHQTGAKETETLGGSFHHLTGEMGDAALKIGNDLIPVFNGLADQIHVVAPALGEMGKVIATLAGPLEIGLAVFAFDKFLNLVEGGIGTILAAKAALFGMGDAAAAEGAAAVIATPETAAFAGAIDAVDLAEAGGAVAAGLGTIAAGETAVGTAGAIAAPGVSAFSGALSVLVGILASPLGAVALGLLGGFAANAPDTKGVNTLPGSQAIDPRYRNTVGPIESPVHGNFRVSQPYGPSDEPLEPAYRGYAHYHQGIDLETPAGTPVYAAAAGRITEVDKTPGAPNEGTIIETLSNGFQLLYYHQKPIEVAVGEMVKVGQELSKVGEGKVGASTGPHTHFGVRTAEGEYLDPGRFLNGEYTGANAGNIPSASASMGVLPAQWLAALQQHESKLPLPTPEAPSTMFGLGPGFGFPTHEYTSEGSSGSTFTGSQFPTVKSGVDTLTGWLQKNVPDYPKYIQSNDFQGLLNAMAKAGYAGPGEGPAFVSQTAGILNAGPRPDLVQAFTATNATPPIPIPGSIGIGPASAPIPIAPSTGVPPGATSGAPPKPTQAEIDSGLEAAQRTKESVTQAGIRLNELMQASNRIVTQEVIDEDQRQVDSFTLVAQAKQSAFETAQGKQQAAIDKQDYSGAAEILKTEVTPAQQQATDATNDLSKAQTKLRDDTSTLRGTIHEQASAWENYAETSRKVLGEVDAENTNVTAKMLQQDKDRVTNAQNAAYAQATVVYELLDQLDNAIAGGSVEEIANLREKANDQQKIYNDSATTLTNALSRQSQDQKAYDAEQQKSADAMRARAREVVTANQEIIESSKLIGIRIPEDWRDALAGTENAVQAIHQQIETLDDILSRTDLTPVQRASFEAERTKRQGDLADVQGMYKEESAAAQEYNQGIDDLDKAHFEQAKAQRALDLADTIEKNQAKLDSDLKRISDSEAAQIATLDTSSQVSRIQAQSFELQASAASDNLTKQRLLLSASLAEQTAMIHDSESKQIQTIRDDEQQKLKIWTDVLLQYQEAQTTSAGEQLRIQANLDEAKANLEIDNGMLMQQILTDEQQNIDIAGDSQIGVIQKNIAAQNSYRQDQIKAQQDWITYTETINRGALKASDGINALTQAADANASKVSSTAQNQLSLLQAQNQAQSTSIGVNPQEAALQNQINQLNVVKDQVSLTLLDQQDQLKALEAQNTILSDQLTMLRDEQASSTAMLNLTTQQETLAVQVDQVHLALLVSMSESQQASIAALKEQLAVMQSQNAVLDAQVRLQTDQAAASEGTLDLSTKLKQLALEKDQTSLAVLTAQSQAQQTLLATEKERLAQLTSIDAVLKDQATLIQDQAAANSNFLAISTQLKSLAVAQAFVQLEILQQTNAGAQEQLTVENAALDVQRQRLTILEDELKLNQDLVTGSEQYLALQASLNEFKLMQDSLAVAGRKNSALDREVQFFESQQKLMVSQNTLADTALQTEKDKQQIQVDQLTLQTAQTQQQIQQNGQLQATLLALNNQADQLKAQQSIMQAVTSLQLDSFTQAEALAKVQQDQINLQIAQNSVITNRQVQLNLQVQSYDRQIALLTQQQTIASGLVTLSLDDLNRQQAKAKVQEDQLTLQQAQQSVITDTVSKLTLQEESLKRQSDLLDAQKKLLTDQNTLAANSLTQQQAIAKVTTDQLNLQLAQVNAQQAMANGLDATLGKLNAQLKLLQDMAKVAPPAALSAPSQGAGGFNGQNVLIPPTQPNNFSSQNVLVPPSQPPGNTSTFNKLFPSGQTTPQGTLLTSGQYAGYTVTHVTANINIGGKLVTQVILEDLHTGQTLDVDIP